MRHRFVTVAVVIALGALVPAGIGSFAQTSAGVTAVYKTSNVSEAGGQFSMGFTVRLSNPGDEDRTFSLVKLTDPANVNTFARWERVSVPAKGKVDLSDDVTVTANEYKRWKNGGTANLYVVQPDPEGTTRATAVSASFQATGW